MENIQKKANNTSKKGRLIAVIVILIFVAAGIAAGITAFVLSSRADRVYFTEKEYTMYIGETYELKLNTEPEGKDTDFSYTSSDENIATVSEDGVVKAVMNGEAEITATDKKSGKSDTLKLTVDIFEIEILLDEYRTVIDAGEDYQINAEVKVRGNVKASLSYTSSNTDAAVVSEDGVITGVGAGSSIITVENKLTQTSTVMVVRVRAEPEEIGFEDTSLSLVAGESVVPRIIFFPG